MSDAAEHPWSLLNIRQLAFWASNLMLENCACENLGSLSERIHFVLYLDRGFRVNDQILESTSNAVHSTPRVLMLWYTICFQRFQADRMCMTFRMFIFQYRESPTRSLRCAKRSVKASSKRKATSAT